MKEDFLAKKEDGGNVDISPESIAVSSEDTVSGSGSSESAGDVSKKQKLLGLLKELLGEGYNEEDEEDASGKLFDYINSGRERQGKLAEALTGDPRLAQLLSDIVGGKKNAHSALVRYFGKDFLSAEEGTPEYEELMMAEEDRKKESEAAEAGAKEYSRNLDESMPIVEGFCKEKGYDPSEYLDRVWNQIISPIISGKYSRELCDILDNGLNYSSDIEDAMKAGEVRGRNMNISRMRKDEGDGLPKNIGSIGNVSPEKKTKGANILDMAKDA